MDRLGSANKVAGIKQTKNALVSGKALLVYTANDANPQMLEEVLRLCRECGVEVVTDYSRKELSKACRIDVLCSAAAVIK